MVVSGLSSLAMKSDMPKLVAVHAADLHLDSRAPPYRSLEEDWLATQTGYLRQLKQLCRGVPLLLAGDVFNKATPSPEIITLALETLPSSHVYGICGNHDAPFHRLEDLKKSAYGVLVAAKKIIDVVPGHPVVIDGATPMRLHGFPCGVPVEPLNKPNDFYLEIALIHSYVWTTGTGYPGASEKHRLGAYKKRLTGYDIALFGDNHITTTWNLGRTEPGAAVFNPGSFTILKRDQKNHRPCVGLIYADSSVEPFYLDVSQDKYLTVDKEETSQEEGSGAFIASLLELGECALNFKETLLRVVEGEGVDSRVRDIIIKLLDKEP